MRLTIDTVLTKFRPLLLHRIRQFHVHESAEDCFQEIVLAMITPSQALGSSYLDRYNPERGSAQNYVLMFTVQQMMKLHAKESNRRRIMPEPLSLSFIGPEESPTEAYDVAESTIPDPAWSDEDLDQTIRSPEDLRRFFAGTGHEVARSHNSAGEPRSTVYMLELLLFGGLSISEIAARLEITPAEVHRRLKLLRKDSRIQALRVTATAAA